MNKRLKELMESIEKIKAEQGELNVYQKVFLQGKTREMDITEAEFDLIVEEIRVSKEIDDLLEPF